MARPDLLARTPLPADPAVPVVRARPGGIDIPGAVAACLTMLTGTVLACRPDTAGAGTDHHRAGTAQASQQHLGTVQEPPDPGAPPLSALKVPAEAAMLLGAAARTGLPGTATADAIKDLADALVPLRDRAAAVRLCLHPSAALDLALVHLHLRRAGYPDPQWDRLLHDLLDAGRLPGPERLPHRDLEQAWLLDMWTGAAEGTRAGRIPPGTALAHPLDALNCTVGDLYELTHTALYAGDLGHVAVALPRPARDIVADAEVGLAVALDADNLDVATELLWLWPMLHLPWTPAARFAWRRIMRAHLTLGFLPGPGFDAGHHAALPPDAAADYVRRSSYHANVAFGILLCALAATADHPGSATDRQPGDAADPCDGQPDSLAITIRLRRDRATHDLQSMRRTLALAVDLGVADQPAPRQAAALLRRAALVLS